MNTGSVLAQFTITLTQAVSEPVLVDWYTSDGTAKAGVDYAAGKGTATFAPGETSKTISILVYGRAVGSEDRSFFVEMLPPVNAILGASIGECIIHVDTTGSTPVTVIVVPSGPRGLEGKSAYQVWLDLGNTGTEQDFIDSLSPPIDEIAAEVAPLIDVGNTTLTAQGTESLGHPDATNVKAVARRVAYVGAAKIANVTLADGDNTLAATDLAGDTIEFNASGFVPRILRASSMFEPSWYINAAGKLVVKAAVAGDVLYAIQYDVASKSQPFAREVDVFEHYERSTYNKLRSFEKGTHRQVTSAADAVLWEGATGGQGPYFRWDGTYPKTVPAGSTPLTTGGIAAGAWVSVGYATLRGDISALDGDALIGGATYAGIRGYSGSASRIKCIGRANVFDEAFGDFYLDTADVTTADNDGTVLIDALGRRWKRQYTGKASILWFGAWRGANSADAIQKCVNACKDSYIPPSLPQSYLIDKKVTVPDGATLSGGGEASVLSKQFNGDVFDAGEKSLLKDFVLLGNGQTYSGKGIIVTKGANAPDRGRQIFENLRITDTQSYCIDYVNAGQPAIGYRSKAINCDLRVYNNAVPTVRWPDEPTTGGNRELINCEAVSGPLLDTGSCDNGIIEGCVGGANIALSIPTIVFGATPKKLIISGNRLASGGIKTTINGTDHSITGNAFAGSVEISAGTGGIKFDSSNVTVGGVVDNSTNKTNHVDIPSTDYTPTWTATGSNPNIGNGAMIGRFSVTGRRVTVEILINFASTTTFGNGVYTFSAPFVASSSADGNPVEYLGSCAALNSGVNHRIGVAKITPGSSDIRLVFEGAVNEAGNTIPFTWKSGDNIRISLSYFK